MKNALKGTLCFFEIDKCLFDNENTASGADLRWRGGGGEGDFWSSCHFLVVWVKLPKRTFFSTLFYCTICKLFSKLTIDGVVKVAYCHFLHLHGLYCTKSVSTTYIMILNKIAKRKRKWNKNNYILGLIFSYSSAYKLSAYKLLLLEL